MLGVLVLEIFVEAASLEVFLMLVLLLVVLAGDVYRVEVCVLRVEVLVGVFALTDDDD